MSVRRVPEMTSMFQLRDATAPKDVVFQTPVVPPFPIPSKALDPNNFNISPPCLLPPSHPSVLHGLLPKNGTPCNESRSRGHGCAATTPFPGSGISTIASRNIQVTRNPDIPRRRAFSFTPFAALRGPRLPPRRIWAVQAIASRKHAGLRGVAFHGMAAVFCRSSNIRR